MAVYIRYNGRPDTLQVISGTIISAIHLTGATSSSAMAKRPRELGDFKGAGQFEAKFKVVSVTFRTSIYGL